MTATIQTSDVNPLVALLASARDARRPFTGLFEITPTCNLRCQFCYVALEPYKGPYLSTDQIRKILDTLAEAGVLWLTLTGGEIFSRRDFEDIYRYAVSKGFLVVLFTNATMVNERHVKLFQEIPPFLVEVSMYGHTAEIYEDTTQIPGSFARFERGVSLLQRAGVPLILKTPVSSFTHAYLDQLVEYADQRALKFKVDLTIDAQHDGGENPKIFRITPRRVAQLDKQVDQINARRRGLEAPHSGLPPKAAAPLHTDKVAQEELYRCGAGRTAIFVDALGNASHCVIDREPSFPMLTMKWEELWQKMGEWVTQPLPKDAPCNGCDMRKSCSNCPARSRLATGNPYLKDTYYCDVTHELHGLEPAVHPSYVTPKRQLGTCAS